MSTVPNKYINRICGKAPQTGYVKRYVTRESNAA
jgi:hypothetical protein